MMFDVCVCVCVWVGVDVCVFMDFPQGPKFESD